MIRLRKQIVTILVVTAAATTNVTASASPAALASVTNWSSNTTQTLPKGRWEIGLFQPLRYGYSDRIDFSTHPIFDFFVPNITMKITYSKMLGLDMATRHSFVYPTLLLRKIQRKGTGGIIAPDPTIPEIPNMFASRNEIFFSKLLNKTLLFTGKAGITIAVKTGDFDERTTIDLPIVFPRLGVYYRGIAFNLGADLDGRISKRSGFLADVDIFLLPGWDEDYFFEHKGLLLWNKSNRFRVSIGYKLTYGKYPFGVQWHLLPLFDIQWAGQRKS